MGAARQPNPHPEGHSCETCVHWNDYNRTEAQYAQCRRNPPQAIPAFKKGTWLETHKSEWCGEYNARESK